MRTYLAVAMATTLLLGCNAVDKVVVDYAHRAEAKKTVSAPPPVDLREAMHLPACKEGVAQMEELFIQEIDKGMDQTNVYGEVNVKLRDVFQEGLDPAARKVMCSGTADVRYLDDVYSYKLNYAIQIDEQNMPHLVVPTMNGMTEFERIRMTLLPLMAQRLAAQSKDESGGRTASPLPESAARGPQ